MSESIIEKNLARLGLQLPKAAPPVANYVPVVISGNCAYVAGQIPMTAGEVKFAGMIGKDLTIEQGQQAAKLCGLNMIAQLKMALGGDLSRVKRCLKLGVFVQCPDGFADQPKVANGVSDFMVALLGDAGKHARSAVGVNALPLNVAVEVDGFFEITH